jgi:signal transduction histidine kinase
MFKSLYGKQTLAFLLIAFTTAALVAIFIRVTSEDRLMELVIEQQRTSLQQGLGEYYAENGSWAGVAESWMEIQFQSFPTPQAPTDEGGLPPNGGFPLGAPGRAGMLGLASNDGTVIVSVDPKFPNGSKLPLELLTKGTPVTVDGNQVGVILAANRPRVFNAQEAQYLKRTNQALIYAMLAALVVALAMGILLARTLSRPLRELTRAAQRITQGNLDQQVRVTSNDEIGELAIAFNRMSQEVARVNQSRRRMTADIAHDLRTPLTVISGYIESMRDGVLKPTHERLSLIYSEIERLQDLVGDLRMLSLADAGELSLNPQEISPVTLLDRAADLFRLQAEQQQVEIAVMADGSLPNIWIDEARMMQVMGNLITNALRSTSAGGKIMLSATADGAQMEICVQDTGTGIEPEDLPFIFDRFHRVDKSRHTETGETGLGLAIVKALVESHHGSVSAESVPGSGTTIRLTFPIYKPAI